MADQHQRVSRRSGVGGGCPGRRGDVRGGEGVVGGVEGAGDCGGGNRRVKWIASATGERRAEQWKYPTLPNRREGWGTLQCVANLKFRKSRIRFLLKVGHPASDSAQNGIC